MTRTMELTMVTVPLPTVLHIVLAAEHAAYLSLAACGSRRGAREKV
jgi:hypothetical protein